MSWRTANFHIKQGDKMSKSFLAQPMGAGSYPGVLMLHEFWGLTENIKNKAKQLAKEGYIVMAPDLYGEGWTTEEADSAGTAMQKLFSNMDSTLKKLNHFLNEMKSLKSIIKSQTVALGYCMGGTLSLNMARAGLDIQGLVSFHGGLERDSSLAKKNISARILVLNGEADSFVSKEQIQKFKEEMDQAQADYRFVNYPHALHGFTNPQATENGKKFKLPLAYNEEADKASWEEMIQFLKELFSP